MLPPVAGANVVGRIRFALERFALPRHSSHVAQLWSLGDFVHYAQMVYKTSNTEHPRYLGNV
jgi:hypothetical protein